MSKRLVRIFPAELHTRLPNLNNFELNVVLFNGNTHFGRLESISSQLLTLRDLRDHPHTIALSDVQEIVYDHRER